MSLGRAKEKTSISGSSVNTGDLMAYSESPDSGDYNELLYITARPQEGPQFHFCLQ